MQILSFMGRASNGYYKIVVLKNGKEYVVDRVKDPFDAVKVWVKAQKEYPSNAKIVASDEDMLTDFYNTVTKDTGKLKSILDEGQEYYNERYLLKEVQRVKSILNSSSADLQFIFSNNLVTPFVYG